METKLSPSAAALNTLTTVFDSGRKARFQASFEFPQTGIRFALGAGITACQQDSLPSVISVTDYQDN